MLQDVAGSWGWLAWGRRVGARRYAWKSPNVSRKITIKGSRVDKAGKLGALPQTLARQHPVATPREQARTRRQIAHRQPAPVLSFRVHPTPTAPEPPADPHSGPRGGSDPLTHR